MNNDNRPNDNNYQNNMVNNVSSATNREHSSNKAPVSEIELFKKQLEQGIREPKDEADEEELHSNNKPLIILACVLVGLALFGLGYLIGMNAGYNNKDKCVDYVPANTDKDKDEDENDTVKEVDIDDAIKGIYSKYHTSEDSVGKSELFIEYYLYKDASFKISSLSDITATYANYIYEKGKTEIEEKVKTNDEGQKYVENADGEVIVKKCLKELFGENLKYKASLFEKGCHKLLFSEDKFLLGQECGGIASGTYNYKLTKAEKDNKYLYLYEEVTTKETDKEDVTNTYKWTLNKDEEGNYYFLRIEKQAI